MPIMANGKCHNQGITRSVLMCNDRTARSFSTPLFAENTDLLHVYYVTGHLGT